MNTTRDSFARRMATATAIMELKVARSLGYSDEAAYAKSFRVGDETYDAAMAPDRILVTIGMRMVGKRR